MIILFLFFIVVFSRYMILIKNISLDISSGRVQDQNETCQCAVFFLPFWGFLLPQCNGLLENMDKYLFKDVFILAWYTILHFYWLNSHSLVNHKRFKSFKFGGWLSIFGLYHQQ